jgi:anaerobic ribonucleoside-triphosphate reductase activating protein
MYYGAIKKSDVANGEGIRTTLFVSGCRNRCKNCFQPETWAFDYGKPFDDAAKQELFASFNNPVVRGLTVLGGEPMEPENQAVLLPVLRRLRERYPEKNVWAFTGYTLETLLTEGVHPHTEDTLPLLSLIDVLVDGRYEKEKRNLMLRFRGSENQRLIDLKASLDRGEAVLWES